MNYIELEKWTLEGLDVDYVPLDNIVRPFAADMFTPKEHEFELALSFLKELLEKNSIKVLYGKDLRDVVGKSPTQVVEWLRELWNSEKYEDFNYAVWLDKMEGGLSK